MHLGFTGTRISLQDKQMHTLVTVLYYMRRSGYVWLHHGDCVGADKTAHGIAGDLDMLTHGHPADAAIHRAFCTFDRCESAKPYLERNRNIVDSTAVLVGCPRHPMEVQRSGTWATLRYARKVGKPVVIVLPDGVTYREGF